MKTFKFSLVLRTRENTDVSITLDDNIYGIHSKRVNILYISSPTPMCPVIATPWPSAVHTSKNFYKYSFFPLTLVQWNALTKSVVYLLTFDAFKEEVGKLHHSRP